MIIVGEKINSSIPKTGEAIKNGDFNYIEELIQLQADSGANFLDINAAVCENEDEVLFKIIDLIKSKTSIGIMADSPKSELLVKVMENIDDRPLIINSVTLNERFDEVVPILSKKIKEGKDISIVGLPLDGLPPQTAEERRVNISTLIEKFRASNIPDERIFIDIITETLATDENSGIRMLDSLLYIKKNYPNIKTICGLSNISFGLPKRVEINSSALAICIYLGLDAAILDSTNERIRCTHASAELILGKDEYCMNYIETMRSLYEKY